MGKISIKNMAIFGTLMALVVVSILILRIPTPQGYIHLGDTFIYLGAILGPLGGFLVGGVGTALADLIAGFPQYAIASLVIHGIQGLLFALLYRKKLVKGTAFVFFLGAFIIGLITVVPGYYIFEAVLYGSLITPLIGLFTNAVQVLAGSLVATLVLKPFKVLVK